MFSTLSAAGASATLEALSAGATDYVTKPVDLDHLLDVMRRWLTAGPEETRAGAAADDAAIRSGADAADTAESRHNGATEDTGGSAGDHSPAESDTIDTTDNVDDDVGDPNEDLE
jgi:DNA-binding response OmpR family regulator